MSDEDMEFLLDKAAKRENRLTLLEASVKEHDHFMEKLDKKLDQMTNWFRGMIFSIIGGVITAAVVLGLHLVH